MVEAGRPYIPPRHGDDPRDPEATVPIPANLKVVAGMTETLLGTLDRYIATHEHVGFPEAMMAGVNFFHILLQDQADRMRLSPEQRESFYLTAVGAFTRSLQGELERLTTVPGPPKPKPTKGVRP